MADEKKKVGFTAAMKNFFGYRSGQGIKEFSEELKALSYEEKMDFHAGLVSIGIDCTPPTAPTVN